MDSIHDNIYEGDETAVKILEIPDDIKKKVKTFGKGEIQFVLPTHQGMLLLLEKVTIYPNSVIIGELPITQERCFAFWLKKRDEMIFRGIDLIEMAAQLLGVWGFQFREIFKEKKREFLLAALGGAKFNKVIKIGEIVSIEILLDKIDVREKEIKDGEGRKIGRQFIIRGREFVVKVGHEVRGKVFNVILMSPVIKIES